MKFQSIILMPFCCYTFCSQAQSEPFKITLPETKVANSLYNSIRLLDIREDTTDFGIAQKGAFNRQAKVVVEIPLAKQLPNVLSALTDKTAQNGELLLLLRRCSFAEVTKAMSETGYFHFRAVLFAHQNDEYKKLAAIDTVVIVQAMDVTKKNFRNGSKTITDFIKTNLTKQAPDDFILTAEQLPKIDSIEKSKLPLYTVTAYTDGIYDSYRSFANQQPDKTGIAVQFDKKGKLQKISYTDAAGSKKDIEKNSFYAFVYEGKPYISGEFDCYPLEKRDNDFYFTGKARDVKTGDVMAAEMFFGIIGGLIASSAKSVFEMKIDYLSGGFIRIKEVNK